MELLLCCPSCLADPLQSWWSLQFAHCTVCRDLLAQVWRTLFKSSGEKQFLLLKICPFSLIPCPLADRPALLGVNRHPFPESFLLGSPKQFCVQGKRNTRFSWRDLSCMVRRGKQPGNEGWLAQPPRAQAAQSGGTARSIPSSHL